MNQATKKPLWSLGSGLDRNGSQMASDKHSRLPVSDCSLSCLLGSHTHLDENAERKVSIRKSNFLLDGWPWWLKLCPHKTAGGSETVVSLPDSVSEGNAMPCRVQGYTGWALAAVAQWIEQGPANQRSPVQFPVRAHGWVAGQVPSQGCRRGNKHIDVPLPLSLPSPLSRNK